MIATNGGRIVCCIPPATDRWTGHLELPMNLRRTLGTLTATVALVVFALPGVATAQGTTDLGPRVERACARVPNLQLRTDNLLTRIQGDASTVGSLAWLDAEIAKAQTAGRAQLVTVLQNRRGVRATNVAVLQKRKTELATLSQRCADLKAQG